MRGGQNAQTLQKNAPGTANFLIAGSNSGLVDTMILAHVDAPKKRITLVSVPRDLYYNSRKINSIYNSFGIEELKRTLATITGYRIDHYILIDMYAFVDVIDLIGGVDVHLDQAVIDPTYKVLDGDQWSTLYYAAGDHHLSGKEALRLARTRHTSSDFARAARQQMILRALQKKALNLGFGDAGTISQLAGAILAKTTTDINPVDALNYYFRYQHFQIRGGNVLSSGNVLESKYTGDLKREQEHCERVTNIDVSKNDIPSDTIALKKLCDSIEKGQYILQPRGGTWGAVQSYVRGIMEKD